jgi:UTP--glucose-1-phosphate uridylyltransferase
LEAAGKDELLQVTSAVGDLANFAYIRQKGPYGTGTPLLNAAHLIGNEPFIYTFADDFVQAGPSRFTQLIEAYAERSGTILTAVQRDGDADYGRYGYVAGTDLGGGIVDVATIIEKPGSREAAPSSLASVSGYVFDPTILEYLQNQLKTYDGSREFMMQESIQQMIDDGHHVYAVEVKNGTYYDTGNPLEYLKTVFDFALEREGIGLELADFLRNKLQ